MRWTQFIAGFSFLGNLVCDVVRAGDVYMTKEGLKFIGNLEAKRISEEVVDGNIPFFKGYLFKSNGHKVYFWNLKVLTFQYPHSDVNVIPGNDLAMQLHGMNLKMELQWKFKHEEDESERQEDVGSLSVSLRGVNYDLPCAIIKDDVNDRVVFGITVCLTKVKEFIPQFKGETEFLKPLADHLKKDILDALCRQLIKIIEESVNDMLN